METNVNYTAVGVFVVALIIMLILGIVWLSVGLSLQEYTVYKVYMRESVSGLNPESNVEYNGVNVGKVKSIQINHNNPQFIELLLNIKQDTPITRGTRAKLEIRSLVGSTYIALEDKGTDMAPLLALPGQPYPVIKTTPSIFVRLDTLLNQLNASFREINTSIRQVSASVESLLDKQNLQSIKQFLANLELASREFHPLLQSTRKSVLMIETQTIPAANQAFINMNSVITNLNDVSSMLKQNPAVIIRGREQRGLGPGER